MIRTVLIGSMLQVSLLDARAYSIHWRVASNTDRLTKFTQVAAKGPSRTRTG